MTDSRFHFEFADGLQHYDHRRTTLVAHWRATGTRSSAPNAPYVGASVASAFWHYYLARMSDSVRRKSRRSKRTTNTTGKLTAACSHVPDIDMSQVRVMNNSVWSKSVAAGLSQWAAVGCAVAGVLLSAERAQALRPWSCTGMQVNPHPADAGTLKRCLSWLTLT